MPGPRDGTVTLLAPVKYDVPNKWSFTYRHGVELHPQNCAKSQLQLTSQLQLFKRLSYNYLRLVTFSHSHSCSSDVSCSSTFSEWETVVAQTIVVAQPFPRV